jgi:hypothetical protein
VTAGWVAASTRGRALLRRTIGADVARSIAAAESWPSARDHLRNTVYGVELPSTADRHIARRAAATATAWQLRVLAGWLPPASSGLVRAFAAPVEIANIEAHLAQLSTGTTPTAPIPLGTLGVAWSAVATLRSADQVRDVLARSTWGDPGGADRATIALGLHVAWARRLARQAPVAETWARGGAALLVAREQFAFDRSIPEATGRELDRLLGTAWRDASTTSELTERLPKSARWIFADVASTADLWLAEIALLRRVTADSERVVAAARNGRDALAAIMALLLVDLWRVDAAIEAAGRTPLVTEVFDAVA